MNVEDELMKLLSEELSKSIDVQIMNKLKNPFIRQSKIRKILDKIQQMKQKGI